MLGLGEQRLFRKKLITIKETIEKIASVTPTEVKEIAQELFMPNNIHLAIISPSVNEDRIMKIISGI
jgi:predicted Zn-dependent peptidase